MIIATQRIKGVLLMSSNVLNGWYHSNLPSGIGRILVWAVGAYRGAAESAEGVGSGKAPLGAPYAPFGRPR